MMGHFMTWVMVIWLYGKKLLILRAAGGTEHATEPLKTHFNIFFIVMHNQIIRHAKIYERCPMNAIKTIKFRFYIFLLRHESQQPRQKQFFASLVSNKKRSLVVSTKWDENRRWRILVETKIKLLWHLTRNCLFKYKSMN